LGDTVSFLQAFDCTDVQPKAVMVFAADLALAHSLTQQRGKLGSLVRRGIFEKRGMINAHAAESQGLAV
jgi:hypothetical protein